ncbi:MAG: flagellar biosynthesis protein FlhB [Clostridiales bacterium]|nr:MAG: flagellar biosynthesis protein FlhB [Clostridiales bacterium]
MEHIGLTFAMIMACILMKYRRAPVCTSAGFAESVLREVCIGPFDSMFFAADEKTEDPTPKKLSEARRKGQVAKSTDLNSIIILVLMALLLSFAGEYGFRRLYVFLYESLSNVDYRVTEGNLRPLLLNYAYHYFFATTIVFGTVMVAGIAANLLQSGFLFSVEPLKPNLKKLNPLEGFKNMFSKKTLFNLAKTLFKFLLVGFVAYLFAKKNLPKIFSVAGMEVKAVFPFAKDLIYNLVVQIALVLGILAVTDYVYQKYDFKKNLKMTKNEIKEEMKQMEGDPQIKSKRKQKQRQLAMSRMMADVPEATVILTNPTHLSIALRYDENREDVPVVVAKGADLMAFKIREIARENDVPMIENKPLARMLYKRSEIGDEVPSDLYQAIAEILAIVYRMKK